MGIDEEMVEVEVAIGTGESEEGRDDAGLWEKVGFVIRKGPFVIEHLEN